MTNETTITGNCNLLLSPEDFYDKIKAPMLIWLIINANKHVESSETGEYISKIYAPYIDSVCSAYAKFMENKKVCAKDVSLINFVLQNFFNDSTTPLKAQLYAGMVHAAFDIANCNVKNMERASMPSASR